MKILKIRKFPDCYGIKMADDLMLNETLGAYFKDAVKVTSDAASLPDNLYGIFALNAALPIVEGAWKRFGAEFNREMEKKRGESYACKDCPFGAGCLISAVLLMADEEQWC